MICLKAHSNNNEDLIIALCDSDLKGKIFEQDGNILDLSSNFYGNDQMKEDDLIRLIRNANSINAVGEESVSFLIQNDIISKKNIKSIKDIPFVFVILK